MSEGEPPFNPMRMYAATRRLGTAHGVSSCATTAYGVALLSNASRLITDGARGQQLRRELASYRARHGDLNCSSLPPVPPVPPMPPLTPPPLPLAVPPSPPPPPPPPPPDPATGCRHLLQAMDDHQLLVDEADVRSADGTLLWLHYNCSARMLVGRGALATTLVDASSAAAAEKEELELEEEEEEKEEEKKEEGEKEEEEEAEPQAEPEADR